MPATVQQISYVHERKRKRNFHFTDNQLLRKLVEHTTFVQEFTGSKSWLDQLTQGLYSYIYIITEEKAISSANG